MGIFGRVVQDPDFHLGDESPLQLRNRAAVARGKSEAVMRAAEARAKALLGEAQEQCRLLLMEAQGLEARADEMEAGGRT